MSTTIRHAVMMGAGAAFALAGCADSQSDTLKMGGLLMQAFTGSGAEVTREQAAAIPYASIGVQLGSSTQGLAVLGKGVGTDRYWYTGNNILFVTRDGRVMQTVGLPYDLTHAEVRNDGAARGVPGTPAHFSLIFDFQDLGAFNVVANCTDTDEGPETIEILGANVSTRLHVEHCEAPQLDWSFQNEFWLDPNTGYAWQSTQNLHPRASLLYVTVFRPESRPRQAAR